MRLCPNHVVLSRRAYHTTVALYEQGQATNQRTVPKIISRQKPAIENVRKLQQGKTQHASPTDRKGASTGKAWRTPNSINSGAGVPGFKNNRQPGHTSQAHRSKDNPRNPRARSSPHRNPRDSAKSSRLSEQDEEAPDPPSAAETSFLQGLLKEKESPTRAKIGIIDTQEIAELGPSYPSSFGSTISTIRQRQRLADSSVQTDGGVRTQKLGLKLLQGRAVLFKDETDMTRAIEAANYIKSEVEQVQAEQDGDQKSVDQPVFEILSEGKRELVEKELIKGEYSLHQQNMQGVPEGVAQLLRRNESYTTYHEEHLLRNVAASVPMDRKRSKPKAEQA